MERYTIKFTELLSPLPGDLHNQTAIMMRVSAKVTCCVNPNGSDLENRVEAIEELIAFLQEERSAMLVVASER